METIHIRLSFKSRWELYLLKIKIGDPHKSKFRVAIDELPELFKKKKIGALFG